MRWRRSLGLAAFVAVLLLVTIAGVGLYGRGQFEGAGPLKAETVVYVRPGSGLQTIATELERSGVIADPHVFQLGVRILGIARSLRAGEYAFPAAVSMRGAAEIMVEGRTVVRRLTLAEGLTSREAAALILAAEGLEGELPQVPPEGSLLPETYHYHRGDSRTEILARMQAARDRTLAELWDARAADLPFKTAEEAVVLASIVEKETGIPEERRLVAGVFVNRLRKGMRLQSDPTVSFGLTMGQRDLGRELTRKDLRARNAYNTYVIDGLPPGPIANAGRAAIEAVLNPMDTDYIYFVADGSGGHAFAKTLQEHNRNVAKWRRLKRTSNN